MKSNQFVLKNDNNTIAVWFDNYIITKHNDYHIETKLYMKNELISVIDKEIVIDFEDKHCKYYK